MESIIRSWNGRTIRQREDGYLSLTDMAQATGKLFGNWYRLQDTQEYLEALALDTGLSIRMAEIESKSRYSDVNSALIEIKEGGISENQGTWGHRLVALEFARWLSKPLAIQCNKWMEELLLNGKVSLVPQQPTPPQLPDGVLPQETIDHCNALLSFYEAYEVIYGYNQGLLHDINNDIALLRGISTQSTLPPKREYLKFKNVQLIDDFEFFHCLQSIYGLKYTIRKNEFAFYSPKKLAQWIPSIATKLRKKDYASINKLMQKFVDMGISVETKSYGNYSEYRVVGDFDELYRLLERTQKLSMPSDYFRVYISEQEHFEESENVGLLRGCYE